MTAIIRKVFAENPKRVRPAQVPRPGPRRPSIEMYKRKNREVLGSAGRYGEEF
ncbi:MAG: hypothetical protein MZV63_13430 [Marinilabiliales bacterium]|nr:hypothetical protein [Marinilabiliales bacterium]